METKLSPEKKYAASALILQAQMLGIKVNLNDVMRSPEDQIKLTMIYLRCIKYKPTASEILYSEDYRHKYKSLTQFHEIWQGFDKKEKLDKLAKGNIRKVRDHLHFIIDE